MTGRPQPTSRRRRVALPAPRTWPAWHEQELRRMYPGGRADQLARRLSLLWSVVFATGVAPRRWVALEVVGRRSGEIRRFPLGMADIGREWYLVSMLGENCNWVRNVRAADGRAIIHRRRRVPCRLVEVPVEERAPIIKRYLTKVPGGRAHIPVDRRAPLAEFRAIAARYPVFHLVPDGDMVRPAGMAPRAA